MQTKNVNIPHPKTEEPSLVSEGSTPTPEFQAPPLPPRTSALQCTHPTKGQCGSRPPDPSAYSAYKSVPPPRPYHPPPYRMPPIPIPPHNIYNKYGSEPFLPGSMTNEAVPLQMYSSKYPPPTRKDTTSKDGDPNNFDITAATRIPNLSELSHVQRPRTAHAAVAPEPSLPPPRAQMWMEEKQTPTNKGIALHQRWRTLLNHSPMDEQQKKERERAKLMDGEPLLPNSRRAISYPDGISNPGLEDEGYVPSTPQERTEGSRGQVLLENKPPAMAIPSDMQSSNGCHMPLTPSSSGASTDVSSQARTTPSVAGWSTGTLSEDGHSNNLRDTYIRLYPHGNQQGYWPSNGVPQRPDHETANEEEINELNEQRETFGENYYPGCNKVSGKGELTEASLQSVNLNCVGEISEAAPQADENEDHYQQAVCPPYNHYPNPSDTQYYQQRSGYILAPDAKHGKFPQKTLFNEKMKFQQAVVSDSFYGAEGSSPSGRVSSGSSDYDKNPHNSGVTNTASESGRGTMPPSSAKSSSLSGTMDSSIESSDASPSRATRKDGKDQELHQIYKSQSRSVDSTVSDSMSVTPPLPPLSPTHSPPESPASSSKLPSKYKLSLSAPTLNKSSVPYPEGSREWSRQPIPSKRYPWPSPSRIPDSRYGSGSRVTTKGNPSNAASRNSQQRGKCRAPIVLNPSLSHIHENGDGDMTSTTTALDMESLLDDVSGSSESLDGGSSPSSDVHELRRQLEGLEQMYSEVLKMLGVKSRTVIGANDSKSKRKVHGSLSSLTGKGYTSSASKTRAFKDKRYVGHDKRRTTNEGKGTSRRFQRLESHVVTLARSVAHLSSEMRTQHVMFQEIENLRREVNQLSDQHMALRMNVNSNGVGKSIRGGAPEWDNFRSTIPSLTNPTRIKKLAKFFGDEPPLLRLFLKKLGYEKYASNFESERIGMIELPYLNEERLQKIGIPMGPRMRILQEAQMSFRQEQFNIYIV